MLMKIINHLQIFIVMQHIEMNCIFFLFSFNNQVSSTQFQLNGVTSYLSNAKV